MSDRPLLRVVKGTPDDEELAALTAAVVALSAAPAADSRPARRSEWSSRRNQVRAPLPHGPGAWRASGFPRG